MNQVEANTGKRPPELDNYASEVPEAGEDLWMFFWEIQNSGGITFQNIYYYQMVMGFELSGEDIVILQQMGISYNNEVNKK